MTKQIVDIKLGITMENEESITQTIDITYQEVEQIVINLDAND